MTRYISILVAVAATLATASACSGPSAQNEERLAELRSQRRSLLMQFSSAQNGIRRVQARALEEEGVRLAQDSFNAVIRAAVVRDDPEAVALLDRAEAVGQDLQQLATPILLQQGQDDPRPVSSEERTQMATELAEVERALRPVISQAFQDSAVTEAFSALRDSVVATMLRIDPQTQRSMDLMADLEGRVAEIDAEIASLSP
jgi:pimeloyl-ACP methyl ester carboxylesterase